MSLFGFSTWFVGTSAVALVAFLAIAFRTLRLKRDWKHLPVMAVLMVGAIMLGQTLAQSNSSREEKRQVELTSWAAPTLAREVESIGYLQAGDTEQDQRRTTDMMKRWMRENGDIAAIYILNKRTDGKFEEKLGVHRSGKELDVRTGMLNVLGATELYADSWAGASKLLKVQAEEGDPGVVVTTAPVKNADGEQIGLLCVAFDEQFWIAPVNSARTGSYVMMGVLLGILLLGGFMVGELSDSLARLRVSRAELQHQGDRIREQMDVIAQKSQEMAADRSKLAEYNEKLQQLATTDGLTGVMNHRTLMEFLSHHMRQNSSIGSPCSVILLDVDNFKQLNDQYGHMAGDDALRTIAAVLRQSCPRGGGVGRYGGEEFMMVLPGASESAAMAVAEELRHRIQVAPMTSRTCTASLGVSTVYSMSKSEQTMIDEADRALYHSKHTGKNRVTHFGHGLLETG